MPSTNILIGVGGTGAKVVECALMMLLAGIGPSSTGASGVTVGFVDQDESNGNVARARHLLEQIEAFRAQWSGDQGGPDRLNGQVAGGELARVAVSALKPTLWCPQNAQASTLGMLFNAGAIERDDPPLKALMDFLYVRDKTELYMDLGEGYRARPHIGAGAMLAKIGEPENAFARAMAEGLGRAGQGQEVRIFLVGSVFGGTGAAGFPNLARFLRATSKDKNGDQNDQVKIGGALMLPYFGFAPPPGDSDNVARADDLLRNSRVALKYYHRLFGRERVFDEFYLTGWSPHFQLGYHASGKNTQANPPLLPELIGAMAAIRFFAEDRVVGEGKTNPTFICARDRADSFTWGDLPQISQARNDELYQKLGQLLRFSVAWRDTYSPALRARYSVWSSRPTWWRKQAIRDLDLRNPQTANALTTLDALAENILHWAASMQFFATTEKYGDPGVRSFGLWDASDSFTYKQPDGPGESPTVLLKSPAPERVQAYDRLIPPLAKHGVRPRLQSHLNNELSERVASEEHAGLGRFVAAVHLGARTKSDQNDGARA